MVVLKEMPFILLATVKKEMDPNHFFIGRHVPQSLPLLPPAPHPLAERELHAVISRTSPPFGPLPANLSASSCQSGPVSSTTEAELRAWLIAILKNEVGQMQRKFFDTQKRDIRQVTALPENADDWLAGNSSDGPVSRLRVTKPK